jgi:hypothetical protein
MDMQFLAAVGFLAISIAGCGSTIGNGSDPGTGTRTLLVSAKVEAENRLDNATEANGFDTKFEVTVKRAGADVADAQVVLTSASGTRTLTHAGGGKYTGGHVGYDRNYDLRVTAGADNLNAMIAGPTLHRITSPAPGAMVPPRQDLTIHWTRDGAADSASVETKEFKVDSTPDRGTYVVPGAHFPGKPGDTVEERAIVYRRTRVGLAGGTTGSQIEASVRNRVGFLVAPRP